MDFETIILKKEEHIATITLNRPERMNAVNPQMERDLVAALEDVAQDGDVRVVVIAGSGRAFCSGADVGGLSGGGDEGGLFALTLGLGECLYLGWGEEATGGRHRPSNLAAAFEAVVGAILTDQGFAVARDFVLKVFGGEFHDAIERMLTLDYKSRLQEVIQARHHVTPVYRTIEAVGPEHAKEFTVEVVVEDSIIGRGHGSSKRMAEKEAARDALEGLSRE